MKPPQSQSLGHQELLRFDGPMTIPTGSYNRREAKEAALHRKGRKGELELTARTKGFQSRTDGLWIPHSGLENSAVVKLPLVFLTDAQRYAKERVIEKYEESDIPHARVLAWAFFARQMAGREMIQRFDHFRIEAQENHRRIRAGLGPEGEIERDRIEASAFAVGGLLRYLMSLRSFIGTPDVLGKGERRKWPQKHHHKQYARRQEQAREFLGAMPDWDFDLTVKEAYWAERSRYEYWTRMENLRRAMGKAAQRDLNANTTDIPVEAYEDDPRGYAENYVDGEYIGD